MEGALNLLGGVTISPASSSRTLRCQSLLSRQLHFVSFIAQSAGLYTNGKRFSCRRVGSRVSCEWSLADVLDRKVIESRNSGENEQQFTCVMKFGGSSVASAERMIEVAELIRSFPQERPVIVLSAMGKTTNKLLLVCIFFPSFLSSYYYFWKMHFILLRYISMVDKKFPGNLNRLEKRLWVVVLLMLRTSKRWNS